MVAADGVTIALGIVTMLTALAAFLEATYPPETKRAKRIWAAFAVFLACIAIVLVIVQVDLAAKDRGESAKETKRLNEALNTANAQLKTQGGQISNLAGGVNDLKNLMRLNPSESPDKVLAAAAAKILELEKTSKMQGTQIESLQSRHLSAIEKSKLHDAAIKVCPFAPKISVTASNGNQEAQAYGMEFVEVFRNAGCPADLDLPIPGLTPEVRGVHIGVRDLNNPGNGAKALATILSNASIAFHAGLMKPDFFADSRFVLVIDAKQN